MKPSNLLMLWFTVGVIIMVVGGSIVFLPGLNLTAGPYFFIGIICIHICFFLFSIWNFFNQGDPCTGCRGYRPMRQRPMRRRRRIRRRRDF